MRLFVAIFPNKKLRDYFRDVRRRLRKFKRNFNFVGINQLHLTVKYLGNNIEPEVYEIYTDNFRKKIPAIKAFNIKIKKIRFGFKSKVRPRILFFQLEENSNLDKLTSIATKATKIINPRYIISRKDRKKLIHHFTLGRVKSHQSRSLAKELEKTLSTIDSPNFSTKVSEVAIVNSKLTPQGPIYEVLDKFKLKD